MSTVVNRMMMARGQREGLSAALLVCSVVCFPSKTIPRAIIMLRDKRCVCCVRSRHLVRRFGVVLNHRLGNEVKMNFLSSLYGYYNKPPSLSLNNDSGKSIGAVLAHNVEVGSKISLKTLDGQIFPCAVLRIDPATKKQYLKDKHLLAITRYQIVELVPIVYPLGCAEVCEVHELLALAKLRYGRSADSEGRVLMLEYHSGKVGKFLMANPSPCVDYIKEQMTRLGMVGESKKCHLKATLLTANEFMASAKEIESQFSLEPSVVLVEQMMNLLRQAVEKFDEANDPYFETVVGHIRNFLLRDDVTQVLEIQTQRQGRMESVEGEESVLLEDFKDCLTGPHPSSLPSSLCEEGCTVEEKKEDVVELPAEMLYATGTAEDKEDRPSIMSRDDSDILHDDHLIKVKPGHPDHAEELDAFLEEIDVEFHNLLASFGQHSNGGSKEDGVVLHKEEVKHLDQGFDLSLEELDREFLS